MNIVEKDEQIAAVRKSGEVIGEIALFIPQQRRTLTVITTEPTEILEWEISQVREVMPEFRKKLYTLVWKRLPPGFVMD